MKKRLMIIGIFALFFLVVTLILIITSGESDSYNIDAYLVKNGYSLVDKDTSQYIKETGTIDNFYYLQQTNKDSTYLAYYFSIQLKTFKEYKMNYSSDSDSTIIYTLSNKLDTDIIEFNYEISNDDNSYSLEGTYNIKNSDFECNLVENDLVDKTNYCNDINNKIKSFIPKRNNLLKNDYIIKAISTKQNEVVVKGRG